MGKGHSRQVQEKIASAKALGWDSGVTRAEWARRVAGDKLREPNGGRSREALGAMGRTLASTLSGVGNHCRILSSGGPDLSYVSEMTGFLGGEQAIGG